MIAKLTRGEALRLAMMALVDGAGYVDATGKTEFAYAHPLFWAPYTIIGDGGVVEMTEPSRRTSGSGDRPGITTEISPRPCRRRSA